MATRDHVDVEASHLFSALLLHAKLSLYDDDGILNQLGTDTQTLQRELVKYSHQEYLGSQTIESNEFHGFAFSAKEALKNANDLAQNYDEITPLHLLAGIIAHVKFSNIRRNYSNID